LPQLRLQTRSFLAAQVRGKGAGKSEKARKRIEKITNPKANILWRELKALFKVAFFSALLAAVFLICQKPEGLPEGKKEPSMRLVSSDMMDALGSPIPKRVEFSDDDINQYLKQAVKPRTPSCRECNWPGPTFIASPACCT